MTLGCLAIQVFGGPGAGQHDFQMTGRMGIDYLGVYPPHMKTVQWPPSELLTDATLSAFADPLAPLTHV